MKCLNATKQDMSHVESIITNSRLEESYLFIPHKNKFLRYLQKIFGIHDTSEHIYHPIHFLPNRFQR